MRVTQVVPSLDVGGAERMAALLSVSLRDLGHQVEVVSLYRPSGSWIEEELRAADVPVSFLGKGPGFDARVVARLTLLLRRQRPEVVHTHLHGLRYALPCLPVLGACFVHTLHNLAEREVERPGRWLQHIAFRAGVAPVAIGDAVADSVLVEYGRPPAAAIANGIRLDDYAVSTATRDAVREALGLARGEFTFLVAGRLGEQKNHRLLVEAMGHTGGTLLVAGDGPLRSALEVQAAPLGRRVRFLGVRRDVPALLAAADALVLASSWEGNPLVVMEAMAAGRPVVATAVGCVPELLVDGTGILVRPGDAGSLRGAMLTLERDPGAAAAMGRRGREHAARRFDSRTMAQAYADLYRRLRDSGGALGRTSPAGAV